VSLGFTMFLIEDFKLAGSVFKLLPDGTILPDIYKTLIILVVAEVYKVGLDMKNDAELTI
jgi:hypothetical protein